MFDSVDGKKAGVLKDVGTTTFSGTYDRKGGLTINTGGPCIYVKAPEFIEPVTINSPIYSPPINPLYAKLAKIAYDTVLRTMQEGEKEHGADEWERTNIPTHGMHLIEHIYNHSQQDASEDHIAHAMTRCAMIKYLEDSHE